MGRSKADFYGGMEGPCATCGNTIKWVNVGSKDNPHYQNDPSHVHNGGSGTGEEREWGDRD